ncbi:MAG: DUF58 domain-containing protein [Alphaproteobacteria bacterium]|nr:MAG: DUF58 domain-containing protein [Alphaproteobacteria bacterium]
MSGAGAYPTSLRRRAEALAAPFPPLLAEAEHLAASLALGEHGRRRPGMGDEFWQYRTAEPGDPSRGIDWRRSARSDAHLFVRQKEWQAMQSVLVWPDLSAAMRFSGDRARPPKARVAAVLGLALASLLLRGGERVGLLGGAGGARAGRSQLATMARQLGDRLARDADDPGLPDYGVPPPAHFPRGARAVFLSDFLGPVEPVEAALGRAADRGVRGALVQILDPVEESFPWAGRTLFESVGRSVRHETMEAGALRDAYRQRLAAREARLAAIARRTGWRFVRHHTDQPATACLLWLHAFLSGGH